MNALASIVNSCLFLTDITQRYLQFKALLQRNVIVKPLKKNLVSKPVNVLINSNYSTNYLKVEINGDAHCNDG